MEERMKLKIMTWNINGAAALGWDKQSVIKRQVVDAVVEQKADVISQYFMGRGRGKRRESVKRSQIPIK